jgi:hypothetical protein
VVKPLLPYFAFGVQVSPTESAENPRMPTTNRRSNANATSSNTDPTEIPIETDAGTVTVPITPPRDPSAYRATDHFRNRLRERVDDHRRDTLPAELIREGRVRRAPATADDVPEHERGACVAFTTATATGRPWTLIAALRPLAFTADDQRHRAITIYQGPAPDATATARGGRRE